MALSIGRTLLLSSLFTLVVFFVVACSWSTKSTFSPVSHADKHKGFHVFGMRDSSNLSVLDRNNIEWVALVPWGFQSSYDSPSVRHHNGDSIRMKENNNFRLRQFQVLHEQGYKVFLKPHIWMDTSPEDKWRSDIFPRDEESWVTWSASYREFILRYAALAEKGKVEMFCVGTELTELSLGKTLFWRSLIKDIRKVYTGKLTYAANWYREFENIEFWDDLDYIGVQAYFPLVSTIDPSSAEIRSGWKPHVKTIDKLHRKFQKPVLFTEIGYKSTSDTAEKPWEWINYESKDSKTESQELQSLCYEAFFSEVWDQPWMAGVYFWQLRTDHKTRGSNRVHLDFTPLGKTAESVVREAYSTKN